MALDGADGERSRMKKRGNEMEAAEDGQKEGVIFLLFCRSVDRNGIMTLASHHNPAKPSET